MVAMATTEYMATTNAMDSRADYSTSCVELV